MMFDMKTFAITAFYFAALGNSHMLIVKPVPYGKDTLDTSPLVDAAPGSSGSDFPCKQRPGVYDISEMNHIEVGQPQELSFSGSASHGGGTCQLAITKDKEPTAQSTFKLFQVFEGGCPINSDGNSGSHPFTYVLPKDMPNGQMTFAWLWYNRIGNRELYMNCAPITVTGGSDNDDYFNTLPNAYIVNMPTSECQTSFEGIQNAVTIPNPGQFIMKQHAGQEPHAATGPGCAAAGKKMIEGVSGYKSNVIPNGAGFQAPGGAAAAPPAAPSGAASAAPSGGASAAPSGGASAAPSGGASAAPSGGASAAPSGAASAAPSGSAAAPSAPAPSAPAASGAPAVGSAAPSAPAVSAAPSAPAASGAPAVGSAAPSAPAPSAPAPSGAVPSGSACSSSSAAMTCSSDGKQFGVCDNGSMVWRPVAAGTSCVNGQIQKRDEVTELHMRRIMRKVQRNAW